LSKQETSRSELTLLASGGTSQSLVYEGGRLFLVSKHGVAQTRWQRLPGLFLSDEKWEQLVSALTTLGLEAELLTSFVISLVQLAAESSP